MTVSPGWPTDGNRPDPPESEPLQSNRQLFGHDASGHPASGHPADRRSESTERAETDSHDATVAPTLFQLPDLGRPGEDRPGVTPVSALESESFLLAAAASNGPPQVDEQTTVEKIVDSTESDFPATADSAPAFKESTRGADHADAPAAMSPPSPPQAGTQTDDSARQSDTRKSSVDAPASRPATPRTSPPRTSIAADAASVPVGRIWMETIRAHGTVVAILGVVVVGAIISGRGGDDDMQSSLARQSELAELQNNAEGISQELASDGGPDVVEAPDETPGTTPAEAVLTRDQFDAATPSDEESVTVQLDPPAVASREADLQTQSQSAAATSEADAYSELIPQPETVDAFSVSNQPPTGDYESLPSLQDLLEPKAATEQAASEKKPAYRTTKTPRGLSNLLKHLDAFSAEMQQRIDKPETKASPSDASSYFDLPTNDGSDSLGRE